MTRTNYQPDPKLDLLLEREVDVSPELVWTAWTTPEHIKHWFTPAPWKTIDCEIDLRAGGRFYTVMQSPDGQDFPSTGCYLEVIENRRLVWTNALEPGFRPSRGAPPGSKECEEITFTAVISLEPHGAGTKYTALAMHREEDGCKRHEEMGFHDGWGTVLDQLVAHMKRFAQR